MSSEWEMLLRLAIAAVLAGILGWKRESLGKPAGLRTHVLVGVGAALAVAVGDMVLERASVYGDRLRFDPLRVLEAVLASIGFLGAGTIVFRRGRDRVSGLTTAASIWTTAGIGLATGAGSYVLAVGATALIFGVLCGLGRIERHYTSRHRPSDREADPAPSGGAGAATGDNESRA